MLVYIIIFIFIMVLAIEYEFNRKLSDTLIVIVALTLSLLAGFRHPSIVRDYDNYLYSFELIYGNNDSLLLISFEPGFILIVNVIRFLFVTNYGVGIMLVYAFMSVFIKTWSVRKLAINPYLVILLYFSHFFMLQEMVQIRIGLASAIFFYSIKYYLSGDLKKFALIIIVATLFHYSAILYLLVLFFKKDSFNRMFYFSVIILSIALSFFHVPLVSYLSKLESNEYSGKMDNYIYAAEYSVEKIKVLNFITIANIVCCLYLIIAVAPSEFVKDKRLGFFLKCSILSTFLLSFLSGVPSIAFRISDLFGILTMFTFAYLARYLPFRKFNIFAVILLSSFFFYYYVLGNDLIKPYKAVVIKSE